jgi:site-specific DNA-methyltransferase (adenine-specific)
LDKLGPYELGRIYQGDCLELMKAIPSGSVPMIWTDPPYGHRNNDGDLAHNWENALGIQTYGLKEARPILNDSAEDMERVLRGMLTEAGRILNRDCCCCCCCCGGGGPTPTFARVAQWMDIPPLSFFHAIVWDKGGLGLGWRYRRNYEFVMVAHRVGGKLLWNWDGSGVETANVIRIGKILPQSDDHPTPKPVALIEHFLRLHTAPGDIVLDPFAGSGPTGVACAKMGRRFLGFELDQKWVDLGNDRIKAQEKGMDVDELRAGQTSLLELIE